MDAFGRSAEGGTERTPDHFDAFLACLSIFHHEAGSKQETWNSKWKIRPHIRLQQLSSHSPSCKALRLEFSELFLCNTQQAKGTLMSNTLWNAGTFVSCFSTNRLQDLMHIQATDVGNRRSSSATLTTPPLPTSKVLADIWPRLLGELQAVRCRGRGGSEGLDLWVLTCQ